jgi:hypothetical protein
MQAYKIVIQLVLSFSLVYSGFALSACATPKFHGIGVGQHMIDFPHKKVADLYFCKPGQPGDFDIDKTSRLDALDEVLVPAAARLQLNVNYVGAEDLAWLTRLHDDNIASLSLQRMPVDAVGLYYVGKLSALKKLILNDTEVDDKSLKQLRSLLDLVDLDLAKTAISGSGLAFLRELKKLKRLDLGYNNLTESNLASLSAFGELRYLDLSHCALSDKCVDYILANRKLEVLSLKENPKVSDRSLAKLVGCPQLWSLNISGTSISAKAIKELAALPRLKLLKADEKTFGSVKDELSKRLPHCRLELVGNKGKDVPAELFRPLH